jgi:hypothetical protein
MGCHLKSSLNARQRAMHSSRTHSETRCNLSYGRSRPMHLDRFATVKHYTLAS